MAESTATLRQEMLALAGIDIMLDKDTFKSTYQIMDELSKKWGSLSDIAQATITELMAGKHQGNIMSSLMTNFDTARAALETSLTSSGSAMREHEKWQKSLEAQLNKLKASWQALSQSFMNSSFLKAVIKSLTGLVDVIEKLISHFGLLGTIIGSAGAFKSLKILIPTIITSFKILTTHVNKFGVAALVAGRKLKRAFADSFRELGKALAFAAIIKAIQDISSWISEAGKKAETAAEKFDRISDELSGVDSELSSLESELSSVESQIDELLAKDELTFTEQEELDRLRDVSKELERQIELTETLQKSLQKSQSDVAMGAYSEYSQDTSFYSTKSKDDRKEEAKAMGSSIGNIAGLIIGAVVAGAIAIGSGGTLTGAGLMAGAGIGSAIGSIGGSAAGGAISNASYNNEITVREMLDKMRLERIKLENAKNEAYEAYTHDPTDKNKQAYEDATTALNDYNSALSNHMSQLSEYYNSIDYASLTTDKQKEDYIKMGDDLDKYNIEMGVKGAKTTALDRYFSDELIDDKAKKLKLTIEAALNSGKDISFSDLDKEIIESNSRLKEMGITITEVIAYFKELEEAQTAASNYDTYEMVSSIALLSDGVTKLTDAFKEFNETGIVSAATLVELHEIFGNLGDVWSNYVDMVSSGTASILDIQEQTSLLAEEHLGNLFKNGGIKFNDNNGEYDEDKYKTYLSTINQLEQMGVENAKEYVDALQQQAMAQDAVNQIRADAAEIDILDGKENKTKEEIERLEELQTKISNLDGYIANVELVYGVRLKNESIVSDEHDLSLYQDKVKESNEYLSQLEKTYNPNNFLSSLESERNIIPEYLENVDEFNSLIDDGINQSKTSWTEVWEAAKETADVMTPGFADIHTKYDRYDELVEDISAQNSLMEVEAKKRQDIFDNLVDIANKEKISLDGIEIGNFDANNITADSNNESYKIFSQVYERVKSEIESNVEELNSDIDELEAEINDELNNLGLEIDFGRNFNKIVIDNFKSNLEQLGTAMSESISGSGLSIDSMEAIENIFGDLDGFDASALFENTANGIRLNRTEFGKLNDEFKKSNVDSLEDRMSYLNKRYEDTKNKLHDCAVGTDKYNSAIRDLSAIEAQIAANEELISQYKGVFSAYQEWQRMESSGQERDMYENLIKGLEGIDDEISRGWMDDATIEFLELLTGKELSTAGIDAQKEAYKSLKKEIGDSGYSIRDFFTVDKDGNSTNTGVYNFLETIDKEIDGVIKKNEDGRIIGFNFEVAGGNEAIAKTLGISEELVEIMVRAADDAGFVVDVDGAVVQISYLKEQAEKATESLILLKDSGLKELQDVSVDFNLDADGGDINEQYEKAVNLLEKFKKDGKIDFSMDGAQEALDIAKYLTVRIDELTEPRYMQLDTSSVEEKLREPIEKMQRFEELTNQEHLLTLTGDIDGLKDVESEMIGIVEYIAGLNDETRLKLGIDTDWTKDQIYDALKNGEIEIPAQVELDIQMSDDLKDMRLMMMNQLGLVSDAEVKLKVGYNIDDSIVNELTEEEKEVMVKYLADGGDIEEFDEWLGKTRNIEVIAKAFGIEDVDELMVKLSGLDDKTVQAIAEAIGSGDVEALQSTIEGLDGNTVQAVAEALGLNDVETLKTAINNMQGNAVDAVVNTEGQSDKIDTLQSSIFGLEGTTVDVVVNFIKSGFNAVKNFLTGVDDGGSGLNGTANVNGTAFVNGTSGKAFKQGDWRTKKTETALVGELGREIVVTPNNRWHTVGDNGAEFANIPRGSIVFNHRQTEELLANGKVTSGGGRGRAFIGGTAYAMETNGASGYGGLGKTSVEIKTDEVKVSSKNTSSSSANGTGGGMDKVGGSSVGSGSSSKSKSSSSSSKDDFEEVIDWIEIAIDRIEREIDRLEQKAGNIFKSWSSRNNALTDEINKVGKEIDLQQKAYDRYIQEANNVGLSDEWTKKVRNGEIDIETIKDEALKEKIDDYQKWYEKALDASDAIEELKEKESELYKQRFDNVSTQYEGILGAIEHEKNILDEYISQSEAQGWLISGEYYSALVNNEQKNISKLKQQKADMLSELQAAMESETIEKGSEAWYEMVNNIDEVTLSISQSETALLEYQQTIQQISWETFDILQEKISSVAEEAAFLIELLSNDKLYDDNGRLTDDGKATMGLHGQNYNVYMAQANKYADEIVRLDKEIAKDPYDQELINRRQELLEAQQDSILAAEGEKEAIRNMVEEGINLELDALQERIDKYNESIEAQKDLYDYQKKVKEQTEEIASLEKQMAAYSGDTSEEAKAKIQELKVSLEEAKENLQETEYDRYISDQQEMLDELYLEYEEILNIRLDNIDALLSDMITEINSSASVIGDAVREAADSVGYNLSDSLKTIWDNSSTATTNVITTYGEKFSSAQTTTNNALNTINTNLQSVIAQLNSMAKTNVKSASTSSAANAKKEVTDTTTNKTETPKTETPKTETPTDTTIKVGGKINAGSAKIYDYAGDKSGETQYFKKDPIYKVIKTDGNWLQVRWHKLSNGITGWFKKGDVKAYATGAKKISSDDVAWTQENGGKEFIVRPSDGAILTPVARGDSVLNASASKNIWNMANSPAQFIKDNLKLDSASAPNNSTVQSSYTQHLDKVVFNFPNVKNYDEMLSAMQKDKNFERLISSMTFDKMTGKNSLSKGKSIR